MARLENIILPPSQAWEKTSIKRVLARKLGIQTNDINYISIIRRSLDARKKVLYNIRLEYGLGQETPENAVFDAGYKNVENASEVLIIGAGPAGYFAALKLISLGLKPIIIEQGKPVEERKHDIAALHRESIVNTESNYAFGEGGAGTYSDGKLFTRSKKKQDIIEVLQLLKSFGASSEILIDAHPHIGTDKLSGIIKNLRDTIIKWGGEVRFNSKVVDFEIKSGEIKSVILSDGNNVPAKAVIWSTGHSATDTYQLLLDKGIQLETKGFAMGVRIEHQQATINKIRYGNSPMKFLPAASYAIACQQDNRGVYSFCMCPGGQIVPALTQSDTRVVNGMSNSRRNSEYANAGLVVEIRPEDLPENDALAGLRFQQNMEKQAALNSATGIQAPAQALHDFVNSKISARLPQSSYSSGIVSSPMHFWLPEHISVRLQKALKYFGKRMPGFLTNDALMLGVESRTSSTVRILRENSSFMSPNCKGFFPAGEGAGYAGGIMSSAVDGRIVAEKVAEFVNSI